MLGVRLTVDLFHFLSMEQHVCALICCIAGCCQTCLPLLFIPASRRSAVYRHSAGFEFFFFFCLRMNSQSKRGGRNVAGGECSKNTREKLVRNTYRKRKREMKWTELRSRNVSRQTLSKHDARYSENTANSPSNYHSDNKI